MGADQSVEIRLDQYPSRKLKGTIREVAKIDLDTAPRALIAGGLLANRTDSHGVPRTVSTTYQARITLEDDGQPVRAGCPGQCKIKVSPQSLAHRLTRFVSRTFRFAP